MEGEVMRMSKTYNLAVKFNDGVVWDNLGLDQTPEQIAYLLDKMAENDNMELTNMETKEKRVSGEIKSVEIIF
jgi:hypothetical protein